MGQPNAKTNTSGLNSAYSINGLCKAGSHLCATCSYNSRVAGTFSALQRSGTRTCRAPETVHLENCRDLDVTLRSQAIGSPSAQMNIVFQILGGLWPALWCSCVIILSHSVPKYLHNYTQSSGYTSVDGTIILKTTSGWTAEGWTQLYKVGHWDWDHACYC